MTASTRAALLLIAAVAAIGWWMRRSSATAPPPGSVVPPSPSDDEPEPVAEELDWADGEAAAVTVDGFAFIGEANGVNLVHMPDPAAPEPEPMTTAEFLRPGDFTAARIVRGAPSADPWRLELLARDGEYVSFAFTSDEGASCALDLLERRGVMRGGLDDDGRPLQPSAEQFAEARRRYDETVRLLALSGDDEDKPIQ